MQENLETIFYFLFFIFYFWKFFNKNFHIFMGIHAGFINQRRFSNISDLKVFTLAMKRMNIETNDFEIG